MNSLLAMEGAGLVVLLWGLSGNYATAAAAAMSFGAVVFPSRRYLFMGIGQDYRRTQAGWPIVSA
ncbi:hypothetical protein [Phaeobacter italicus]|jgi:hypothetical protein|uniref:hypothetical protein n=1 Tax=Phaeobacter italicus TaxID=481446 RepID=UPI0013F4EBF5|nr:hypothetical protein [Phaeobacter italicus]